MAKAKKRTVRKRKPKKKVLPAGRIIRICSVLFLLIILLISICSAGYVIFFRTAFAQEILPATEGRIVFEEPDPPSLLEVLEQLEVEKIAVKPALPMVAIIIDDMGYHESIDRQFLQLPIELTYSFLPFAPYTRQLEWKAYRAGKTVFLHLPLQPKGERWDAGPGALQLEDSAATQKFKLQQCFEEVPHAVGVNNHMGSLYTEDKAAMALVMEQLEARTLSFVDSCTTADSVAFSMAQITELKSGRRNVFLDNVQDRGKICDQLEKLVKIAEKRGTGIGIAHPFLATVEALASCVGLYTERVQYVGVNDLL